MRMKRIPMTMAALVVLLAAEMASAGLYDSYGYKAAITFSGYNKSETLTNFPALVVLSNNCFSGFAYNQFLSGSNDLAFTADTAGTTNLNYELDTWNTNGSSYLWVQVPALTNNSTITAWWGAFGQPQPVCTTNGSTWSNGFVGVWHMNEFPPRDSARRLHDHSCYNASGATAGVVTNISQIGSGVSYNGNGQTVISNYTDFAGSPNTYTFSLWYYKRSIVAYGEIMGGSSDAGFRHNTGSDDQLTLRLGGSSYAVTGPLLPNSNWFYVGYTYQPGTSQAISNGVLVNTIATAASWVVPQDLVGDTSYTNRAPNGILDEMRFSSVVRSTNWVWAEYLNMVSNGVFNTYGAAGPGNAGLPQISDGVSQNLSNTSADVVGSLITNGSLAATVYLFCATNDCTTNAANWAAGSTVTTIGLFTSGAVFTNTLSSLSPNTVYYWNLMASNTAGTAWGAMAGSPSFKTFGPPGVDNGSGAGNILPYSATLRGTLTNGGSAHVYFRWGGAPGGLTNTLDTGTVSEGSFSSSVTGLARATTYYYSACASNQYGGEITSPVTNFTTLPYVWITASVMNTESQTNAYSGLSVVVDGAGVVLTLSNSATCGSLPVYQFGNLIVTNGAAVVCLGQMNAPYTVTNAGVAIQAAGDVMIAAGCSINADATGFLCSRGPGAGTGLRVGGNYAGLGQANTNTVTYGNPLAPTSLGSGGSKYNGLVTQGMGGGAISLIVAGTLTVNGTLSAAGGSGGNSGTGNGGGAGGSLWLDVGTLAGSGSISANGGAGSSPSGGGGGGRVAIHYMSSSFISLPVDGLYTNLQSMSTTVTVKGGYNTSSNGVEDGSLYIGALPTIMVGYATNASAGSVTLLSSLTSTGGWPTTVYGYWGTNGTRWDFTTNLNVCGTGTVTNTVTGVTPDTVYTFAFMASNSAGTALTGTNTFSLANVILATTPAGLNVGSDGATMATPITNYWFAGSFHALSVTSPQTNGATRYVFSDWTDGGAQSHSYTACGSATVTAQFTTQYLWSATVAPSGSGTVTPPGTLWTNSGSTLAVTATPANEDWAFDHWSGDVAGMAASTNIVMSSGLAVVANFVTAGNAVTAGTSPSGRSLVVDGVVTSEPPAYAWQSSSVHTVAVADATQTVDSGHRYVFLQWEDGSTATQRVVTVSGATNLTATFQAQYLWSWTVTPAGAGHVTPASAAWYPSGTVVAATAVQDGTAPFKVWSGDAAGTSPSATITMNGPKAVTAAFYIAPGVDNGGGATNINLTTATLQATLTNGESGTVSIYWGTDTNHWAHTNDFGTVSQGVPLSTNLAGLAANTTYYYQAYAANPAGTALASVTNFSTLPYLRITNSTTLVEAQTNLYLGIPVVVNGVGVVLTLSNSAVYGKLPVYQFGNLIVTNSASVVCLGQTTAPYTVTNTGVAIQSAGDVVIAAGCSINANSNGFILGNGPGSAGTGLREGGNYAGLGKSNVNTVTYGDPLSPTSLGSGGSNHGGGNTGAGGGAIKLTVAGTLMVNGTLSAAGGSGGPGYTGNGGGAGGSVWLDVGTLAGSGSISANGGSGDTGGGGEGGGGRVAIDYKTSFFTGMPADGLYTNMQSESSTVTAKGAYNTSADGVEDGSVYIWNTVPHGVVFCFQ